MAIGISTFQTSDNLQFRSHWWGFPDLPEGIEWPECDGELLTFICQIDLADLAGLDKTGVLPKEGMLWFFADIEYFLGDIDACCVGSGEWPSEAFRVLYSKHCTNLITHEYCWEDGSPAVLPAEQIHFTFIRNERGFGQKILGLPAMSEGYENEFEGMVSLLQIDSEEKWGLRFFDCGIVNFMIKKADLLSLSFEKANLHLYTT